MIFSRVFFFGLIDQHPTRRTIGEKRVTQNIVVYTQTRRRDWNRMKRRHLQWSHSACHVLFAQKNRRAVYSKPNFTRIRTPQTCVPTQLLENRNIEIKSWTADRITRSRVLYVDLNRNTVALACIYIYIYRTTCIRFTRPCKYVSYVYIAIQFCRV